MPKNPKLFPADFETTGTAEDSGLNALDVAVQSLRQGANLTALRQAYSTRYNGFLTVDNQNNGIKILRGDIPIVEIGRKKELEGSNVNHGYFYAGFTTSWWHRNHPHWDNYERYKTIERFEFLSETLSLRKRFAWGGYHYHLGFSFCLPSSAYIHFFTRTTLFDYIVETLKNVKTGYGNPPRYAGATLRGLVNGYACGGVHNWTTASKSIDRFSYAAELIVTIGKQLDDIRRRQTGCGNAQNGYIVGGEMPHHQLQTKIEKLNYNYETVSRVGTDLSYPMAGGHTWSPGNSEFAYFISGWSYGILDINIGPRYHATNKIGRLDFSNDTNSVIAQKTTEYGAFWHTLIGDGEKTVFYIGLKSTVTPYESQQRWWPYVWNNRNLYKLTYSTETEAQLGTQITTTHGGHAINGLDPMGGLI